MSRERRHLRPVQPLPPTFREWMRRYLGDPGKFGDIAPELVHDETWPDDLETEDTMAEYLVSLSVADSFVECVAEAFALYLAEHPPGNPETAPRVSSGNDEVTEALM